MTTSTATSRRARRTTRIAGLLLVVTAGWIGLAAAVALWRTEPRVVAVVGPPAFGMNVLHAAGLPIVAAGPWAVATRVHGADAVRRLYASGAWLVVEGSAGCNWFTPAQR